MSRFSTFRLFLAASAAALSLSACSTLDSMGASGAGSTLSNLVKYGSTTEPPIAQRGPLAARDCPQVLVTEGRSAIKQGANQISISNLARECIERDDGSIVVKVGVEALALLGPGSSGGRFDVPVSFQLKRGDTTIVSRVRRGSVAVGAGQTQGSFVVVEGDMVVPAKSGDFDIEVGLGGGSPAARARRR